MREWAGRLRALPDPFLVTASYDNQRVPQVSKTQVSVSRQDSGTTCSGEKSSLVQTYIQTCHVSVAPCRSSVKLLMPPPRQAVDFLPRRAPALCAPGTRRGLQIGNRTLLRPGRTIATHQLGGQEKKKTHKIKFPSGCWLRADSASRIISHFKKRSGATTRKLLNWANVCPLPTTSTPQTAATKSSALAPAPLGLSFFAVRPYFSNRVHLQKSRTNIQATK